MLHSERIMTGMRLMGLSIFALNTVRTAPAVLGYLLALAHASLVTISIGNSYDCSLSHTTDVTRGPSLVSGLASLPDSADAIPSRASSQGLCALQTCAEEIANKY